MTEPQSNSAYMMPGLQRGLHVLEILGAAENPMSLSDIARKIDVGRSSAFRILYTLRQMGFLKEGEQKNTYTLGARVLNLGFAYLNQQPITTVARPYLSQLRDDTGVSAHLSVLERFDVLYLSSHQAKTGFVSKMITGTRQRAYASAIGWCVLGDKTDDELKQLCEQETMQAVTEHTPTNFKELRKRVREVCEAGYVFSRGFRDPGGSSVAAPIRDRTGRIVACVNISGPDSGFDFEKINDFYVPKVIEASLSISRDIGYSG